MRLTKLREVLRRAPFQPFAVHLSNGSRYEVRHPDFVSLVDHQLAVTDPGGHPRKQRVAVCDLLHVTHVEFPGPAG